MNDTHPQVPDVTHPSDCPVCHRPAKRETHKRSITGIHTSLYYCAEAHLWELRWTEVG